MLALMSPKLWIAIAFAVLLALLGVQTVRISHAHTELAQERQERAEERQRAAETARKAEQAAREEEQRRQQRIEELTDEANQRTELAEAAARDASAAADSLRERLAGFVARARSSAANPGPPGPSSGQQGGNALDVLAGVFARADDTAGELAAYADRLRIAGAACEAAHDSLTR